MNDNPIEHHEELYENVDIEDMQNYEVVGQKGKLQTETIGVPPIDPVLAQQITSFFKGLVGPRELPSFQSNQDPANPPIAITTAKANGNVGKDAFFLSFVECCPDWL